MKRLLTILFAAALLAVGFAPPASADLAAGGPVDPVTGFPLYFDGTTEAGVPAVGLRVQLCDEFDPDNPILEEQPPCRPELIDPINGGGFVDGNIGEALFYAAAAEFDGPNLEFILAQCILEAAGPAIVGEGNTVGNLGLLRMRDLVVEGDYTVETPCGTYTFNHPADTDGGQFDGAVNEAIGLVTDVPPFSGALLGAVQIFASNGTGDPGFLGNAGGALEADAGPLSNPLRPGGVTAVTVSGAISATSDQFVVVGKLSGCTDANVAPTANPDLTVTEAGTAVVIDVLANDTDVVIEVELVDGVIVETPVVVSPALGTVTIVADSIQPVGSGTATANPDGTVTFTPAAGFAGTASFQYNAIDPCGLISNAATATLLVENLLVDEADYRIRTGKWALEGSSNFRDLVVVTGTETSYVTGLSGAQEVPPRTSAASGEFAATFDSTIPAAFDFDLTINVPVGTTFNRAHIHSGATGVNGGILFTLCDELVVPSIPCTVVNGVISLTGTLTAAELQPVGAITDFAGAVAAIQSGGTYVNVHSLAFPGGEVRGQIGRNVISLRSGAAGTGPAIGAAEVQAGAGPGLLWSFDGRAAASPGAAPFSIRAESSLGITETRTLRLR